MVLIKNLSDIKKEMSAKRPFYIHNHCKSHFIGQIRVANIIQSNGAYLHEYNNPSSSVTLANNAKGSWLSYEKAKDWDIDTLTGHCLLYCGSHDLEHLVLELSFFDDECIKELEELRKVG